MQFDARTGVVDVPAIGEQKAFTRFYGPSAIYSMSPTTKEIAVAVATHHMNVPVQRYELPKLAETASSSTDDGEEYRSMARNNDED